LLDKNAAGYNPAAIYKHLPITVQINNCLTVTPASLGWLPAWIKIGAKQRNGLRRRNAYNKYECR
jgi:hypothetical protein